MVPNESYIVILPYYCQEEITRYLRIAAWMKANCQTPLPCKFLLAASPRAQHSSELFKAFSELGECIPFQCPTQIFGYPEGPTAMFWDCMDFVGQNFEGHQGFSLWLESDMSFTQADWLPRLVDEWKRDNDVPPLMMGCYVPEVYKFRWLRKPKLLLDDHINGGACYAIDFGSRMPSEAREGVFDMAVYKYGLKVGGVKRTGQISFSTLKRVRRDLLDDSKCVLHGFMQEKDTFIDACVRPISDWERKSANWIPVRNWFERTQRRLKVLFVRRGHQAMLENMLLAKHRVESKRKAA